MARLIRTEKEVEGNYTEQWIVVDEDRARQWPAGPLEIVGRPLERVDGRERARGEAVYTADVQLPGMLHTAVLRSPHANARVTKLDLSRALEAPGVRAALTPDDLDVLTREPGYPGAAVAAIAADTLDQAEAARELVDVEWDVLQPLLDPEEAVEKGSLIDEPRALRARGRREGSRRGRRRGRGRVPDADRPAQLDGDAPVGLPVGRGRPQPVHLHAVHLGRARGDRREARDPAGQRAGHLQLHGRRLRREEPPRRVHVHRRRAGEAHRPTRPLRAHAQGGEPRERQPSRDRPASARGREGGRNAHGALRRLRAWPSASAASRAGRRGR